MEPLSEMAGLIARHTPSEGLHASPIPRLSLIRSSGPTVPGPTVYEPALCLVAQGRKQAILGEQVFVYDAARYLLVSVDLPVVGYIIEASPERPYLCFKLDLDLVALGELVVEAGASPEPGFAPGLALYETDPAMIDAAVRLLRLLDRPNDAPVLAPLIEREILYRLLTGDQGAMLRHIAHAQSRLAQVSRAIGWIKRNFRAPFSAGAVAAEAGMSPSSLHEHFRAVTTMSPLQYQKQLRLQEARRLMLAEAIDAATAGFRVGYDSPSQFSREYRRLFGTPPRQDVDRMQVGRDYLSAA
jgi:AraC-like DNA-binding protein